MAFFDIPKDEDLPAESRKLLDEYQRLTGAKIRASNWQIFGRFPKIIEARFLAWKQQWPIVLSPTAILLAFGFSAAIGIFFGFYPARKASRLDPIEALRYE